MIRCVECTAGRERRPSGRSAGRGHDRGRDKRPTSRGVIPAPVAKQPGPQQVQTEDEFDDVNVIRPELSTEMLQSPWSIPPPGIHEPLSTEIVATNIATTVARLGFGEWSQAPVLTQLRSALLMESWKLEFILLNWHDDLWGNFTTSVYVDAFVHKSDRDVLTQELRSTCMANLGLNICNTWATQSE